MSLCVVLTNTTDVYVDSSVNYSAFNIPDMMINLSDICISVHELIWIKLKPD